MKLRPLLILSTIVVLFASCGNKGGKSGLLVPKDAGFVMHINSSSLSSKLSWDEIRQTNWFKEMSKEATDSLAQQLLADPSSSGIDTKNDFVIYMKKQGRGGYMIFEGSLTNVAAYEKLIAELHRKEGKQIEIKKDGDFSYVEGEKSTLIWNKSMFAAVGNAPMSGDMTSGFRKNRSHKYEFENDSLLIFGKEALTLKGSDNLDADSRFADLVKENSDVHFWIDMSKSFSGMNKPALSLMKVSKLLEDNVVAVSMNFDNGKITAKSKLYYGEEMNKIIANNRPEPVSADVINRIPSSDVVAVIAFNYSPKGLKEILKLIEVDALADTYLRMKGLNFSIDDFVKANKGEVLLAVSDPAIVTKVDTINTGKGKLWIHPSSRPDAKVLFATSVKDKDAFEKMVTLGWDMSKRLRGGDNGVDGLSINYKLQNNWLALSNSSDYADKFLAGSNNNKFPFTDKIAGHPIGLYIDLQKIMRFTGSMIKQDSSGNKKAALDASLNMWQDITAKGGDFKNNASEFEFEINLVDKNTNSLKQLNQYMDKMSVLKDEMKKLNAKKGTVIDIEVPNPPAEVK